ncbi:fumarylacetoacetate hydrolase family protein [Streptomyces sp. NPDC002144]
MAPVDEAGDLRNGLHVRARVNSRTVQDGSTSQMIHRAGKMPAISRTPTPHPGDLLSTGTPSGYTRRPPWLLRPGDVVETEVGRLGIRATRSRAGSIVEIPSRGTARRGRCCSCGLLQAGVVTFPCRAERGGLHCRCHCTLHFNLRSAKWTSGPPRGPVAR